LFNKILSTLILAAVCCTPLMALAQHDDHQDQNAFHQRYVRHNEWKRGYHMRTDDWTRAQRVDDWRAYHLSEPPRGYEWREVDGNYILAAVDTGIIASVIVAAAAH